MGTTLSVSHCNICAARPDANAIFILFLICAQNGHAALFEAKMCGTHCINKLNVRVRAHFGFCRFKCACVPPKEASGFS
jgi:hypothetical protein